MRRIPDRLVTELTAHRTLALRNALSNDPHIAFIAALHVLCLKLFYRYTLDSCLEIEPNYPTLGGQALVNLGAVDMVKQAVEALGLDYEELVDQEEEPGLVVAASRALPPAISTRSQPFRFHRSGMASATSSGFSTSRSETDGRWR